MPKPDFKKWTPHLIVIGVMIVFSLLYALPALQGKELSQHDNISWKAMSHEADEWHKRTGENTLWSNSMFGGMPTYLYYVPESDSYMGGVYAASLRVLPKPANFLIVAMLSFYVLAGVLRINRWLGLLGAVAFAFSAYNPIIIAAGHDTKMYAMALMPAVLAGFLLLYRGQFLGGAALFAFAVSLQVMSGHYQVVYYTGILLALVAVGLFIKALRDGKIGQFAMATGLALVVGLVGVGTVAVGLLPTLEYNKTTMRGGQSELTLNHDKGKAKTGGLDKDYAFQWSNSVGETGTLLVPDLYGGGSGEDADRFPKTQELVGPQYEQLPGYWGPQPFVTGADHYLGAVVCFLAVLGLLLIRNPLKWGLLAASILAIIMSWGKNGAVGLNYFLFDHLPFYKNFRTPSMVLIIPQFAFTVLGVWGIHELFAQTDRKKAWNAAKNAAFITGGLALLLGVGGQMFLDFTNPEKDAQLPRELVGTMKDDRASLALKSSLLVAFYVAAAAAVLWAALKDKIKPIAAIGILTALTFVDLYSVGRRYLNDENFQEPADYEASFQPRPVDQQVMADKDPYFRVLDLSRNTYNDAIQAYFFKAIGGYSPAKMESYQDLIDVHMTPQRGINTAVLEMLNTKYIIAPNEQLVPMQSACGNAWFVDEVRPVATADEEMLAMNASKLGDTVIVTNGWNPKRTAIMRSSFAQQAGTIGRDSAASVQMTKYGLNDIHFQSSNSRDGLAVFADIYYDKGWKAFIDDKEVPILKANYLLRALRIPAGQHKIDFRFEPATFKTGNTISAITSIIVILLGITALVILFRSKGKDDYPAA